MQRLFEESKNQVDTDRGHQTLPEVLQDIILSYHSAEDDDKADVIRAERKNIANAEGEDKSNVIRAERKKIANAESKNYDLAPSTGRFSEFGNYPATSSTFMLLAASPLYLSECIAGHNIGIDPSEYKKKKNVGERIVGGTAAGVGTAVSIGLAIPALVTALGIDKGRQLTNKVRTQHNKHKIKKAMRKIQAEEARIQAEKAAEEARIRAKEEKALHQAAYQVGFFIDAHQVDLHIKKSNPSLAEQLGITKIINADMITSEFQLQSNDFSPFRWRRRQQGDSLLLIINANSLADMNEKIDQVAQTLNPMDEFDIKWELKLNEIKTLITNARNDDVIKHQQINKRG